MATFARFSQKKSLYTLHWIFFATAVQKFAQKNKHCLENTLPICAIACLFIAL
jgi:hypothetical protein